MSGWLTRCLADVPAGDDWLSAGERAVAAGLRIEHRRRDWRLGRFTAKAAVGEWLSVAPERVEILAAADGAPEAWLDGEPAPVSISLSHRAGRALAAVGHAPAVVGCDLEVVEPRSDAFVREWLAPGEQALLAARPRAERARVANLVWTAKEAAAKVRREGLRIDVRRVAVTPDDLAAAGSGWRTLRIDWDDGEGPASGWWRADDGWVMTIACVPRCDAPPAWIGSR